MLATTHAVWPNSGWEVVAAAALYAAPVFLILYIWIPPAIDFPNHLVRIWLLSGGIDVPPLSQFYEVRWGQAATNVALDFAAAGLARIVPIFVVAKILIFGIFLGPPVAAATLNRRLFGQSGAWTAVFLLFAWTTTSVAGFMSFQVAIAAALAGAAYMARAVSHRSRTVLFASHVILSVLILAIHPYGLLFYVALLCGLVIGPSIPWPLSRDWAMYRIAAIAALAAVSFLIVVAMFAFAPHPPGGKGGIVWIPALASKVTPYEIVRTLLSPIFSYDKRVDLLFMAALLTVVSLAAAGGLLRAHVGLLLTAFLLAAASVVSPSSVGDATWLDRRIPIMTVLTALAAIYPARGSTTRRTTLAAAVLLLVCLRIVWVGSIWIERDHDARDVVAAARAIPPGASVLLLRIAQNQEHRAPTGRLLAGTMEPTSRHLGTLLVITNHVFVPTLFSIPGQHALGVRSAFLTRSVTSSTTPTTRVLGTIDASDPYVRDWRCNFDYMVVTDVDQASGGQFQLPGVVLIGHSRYVDVGRISRLRRCNLPQISNVRSR